MSDTNTIPVAQYLFIRLHQLGICAIHGVPGDYNLDLLDYVPRSKLKWIGNVNELNAGYAADGYARIKGIGALITTLGVGGLSATNAIASSYTERAPVVHIVGTPSRATQDARLSVHHTLNDGDYQRFRQIYTHVTTFQADLQDPFTAAAEIDNTLLHCMSQSRPVYIQIPVDMVTAPLQSAGLDIPLRPPEVLATATMDDDLGLILDRIYAAKGLMILMDGQCKAMGIAAHVEAFIKVIGWPSWTTPFGKGLIDEDVVNFHGIYEGSYDVPEEQNLFETADPVFYFGPHWSSSNSYGYSAIPKADITVCFIEDRIKLGTTILVDLPAKIAVPRLPELLDISKICKYDLECVHNLKLREHISVSASKRGHHHPLKHAGLWDLISAFPSPGDIILGETGTAGYGIRELRSPPRTHLFTPVAWLSIGYMLPAAQGAAIAQREVYSEQLKGMTDHSEADSHRTILSIGVGSL